ncbi:MAG: hypothetical protein KDB00_19385 [Planctomycetales bacterium]|nr:hypothetical protein [Planctomycetales bacterium]
MRGNIAIKCDWQNMENAYQKLVPDRMYVVDEGKPVREVFFKEQAADFVIPQNHRDAEGKVYPTTGLTNQEARDKLGVCLLGGIATSLEESPLVEGGFIGPVFDPGSAQQATSE